MHTHAGQVALRVSGHTAAMHTYMHTHAGQVALRVSGHTAAIALGYTAPVKEGDVVVVTACCGATGSFAVQLAKAAGALHTRAYVHTSMRTYVHICMHAVQVAPRRRVRRN